MSSKQERQSEVLEHLQEDETSVRIFLTNGFRMYGRCKDRQENGDPEKK